MRAINPDMNNRRHNIAPLLILTVAMILSCCSRQTIYSHYESTGSDGWSRNDSLLFEVGPVRNSGLYEEQLELRLTDAYPFTNIAVIVSSQTLPGGPLHTDTLQLTVADEQGHTKGQGTLHQLFHLPLGVQYLKQDQKLRVCVRHYMTQHTLPGITDVGLTVKMKGER